MRLEAQIAAKFGKDLYFVDTTHNATKFTFKSGPIVSPDCFGKNAPCGLFQIPDKEGNAVDQTLSECKLDYEYAIAATDGGKAWAKPTANRKQINLKDTWHNNKNAKLCAVLAKDPLKFRQHYRQAVYDFTTEEASSVIFDKLMENAKGTRAEAYVTKFYLFKEKRCFTYEGRHFSCTLK